MKLTLTPTETIQLVDGSPARKWEGTTEQGVPVMAFIRAVQPQTNDPAYLRAFEKDLQSLPTPKKELVSFDMRFVG